MYLQNFGHLDATSDKLIGLCVPASLPPNAAGTLADPVRGSSRTSLERALLSPSEKTVMRTFQQYLVTPGEMLCFFGPNLERHKPALQQLTKRDLLVEEQFQGAYSLTNAGFEAMKTCEN